MAKDISLLDRVEISEPCRVSWRRMEGDAKVRFCPQCEKHVYNLAAMTRGEAERVIHEHGGNFCGRIARKRDGRIITRREIRGDTNWRRVLSGLAAAIVAAYAFFASGCIFYLGGARFQDKVCVPPPESTSDCHDAGEDSDPVDHQP